MILNYNNPEGNASYYGNQYNPEYGLTSFPKRNHPIKFLSTSFPFKKLPLNGGAIYNSAHGGMSYGKSPGIGGRQLSKVSAASRMLKEKMIMVKDWQNGKKVNQNSKGTIMKRNMSHFDKNYGKSLIYGKNYPQTDSKITPKSIYTYIDEDPDSFNPFTSKRQRNSDYKSLFDHDNDDEIIKARHEFKKERKKLEKTNFLNTFKGNKKVKM